MYTVVELSKLLNVSRNTIYERLKASELQEFIIKDDKGTKLQKEGLSVLCLLLENVKVNRVEQSSEQMPDKYVELLEATVKELKNRCAELERNYSDAVKQILAMNDKILEANHLYRLESLESKKNKGLFKLFNRN